MAAMGKKKRAALGPDVAVTIEQDASPAIQADEETQPPPLLICRNKHWRYISAYHGPWLQLPPELLETIAHTNHLAPRPRAIDSAVCFDLLHIRAAVDEAAAFTVRAATGLTAAALRASSAHFHQATALGLGSTGPTAELSRERKQRMRALAARRLAQAYRRDEIAASVATMQATSAIDEVASLVLQRGSRGDGAAAGDADARYVRFFHEKIPSRRMAEHAPEGVLDALTVEAPGDPAPLRTRALVRVFKEDYAGAVRDLTAALRLHRHNEARRRAERGQEVVPQPMGFDPDRPIYRAKVEEADQPSSLDGQLLFQRAYVYLAMACQQVDAALNPAPGEGRNEDTQDNGTGNTACAVALNRKLKSQALVRTYARHAIRDLVSFLNILDYTPGLSLDIADRFVDTVLNSTSASAISDSPTITPTHSEAPSPDTLTSHRPPTHRELTQHIAAFVHQHGPNWIPKVHPAGNLFGPTPPADLPPFPPAPSRHHRLDLPAPYHESLTFHPLATEALHLLLLAHALAQTRRAEMRRHARHAARLASLADGYPVFATGTRGSRGPARADWVAVLRAAAERLGVEVGPGGWEGLCRLPMIGDPNPAYGRGRAGAGELGEEEDGVEASAAGAAGLRSSERVERIVRWVMEAPEPVDGAGWGRKSKGPRRGKGRKERKEGMSGNTAEEIGGLSLDGPGHGTMQSGHADEATA